MDGSLAGRWRDFQRVVHCGPVYLGFPRRDQLYHSWMQRGRKKKWLCQTHLRDLWKLHCKCEITAQLKNNAMFYRVSKLDCKSKNKKNSWYKMILESHCGTNVLHFNAFTSTCTRADTEHLFWLATAATVVYIRGGHSACVCVCKVERHWRDVLNLSFSTFFPEVTLGQFRSNRPPSQHKTHHSSLAHSWTLTSPGLLPREWLNTCFCGRIYFT